MKGVSKIPSFSNRIFFLFFHNGTGQLKRVYFVNKLFPQNAFMTHVMMNAKKTLHLEEIELM